MMKIATFLIGVLAFTGVVYATVEGNPATETSLWASSNFTAYFPFDTAQDNIGLRVPTVFASTTQNSSTTTSKFIRGIKFNGDFAAGNELTYDDGSGVFDTDVLKTVAFWFKTNETPAAIQVFMDNSNTNSGATNFIRGALESDMTLDMTIAGAAGSIASNSAINLGQWYHVCMTHNANVNTALIYLDGSLVATGVTNTAIGTNNIDFFWGRLSTAHGSLSSHLAFEIDDLVVFNRQITAAECLELAQGTRDVNARTNLINGQTTLFKGQLYSR